MCPENVQEFEPYYTTCLISIGMIVIQIIILKMQESISPRFFIPAIFLPPKYDYFRSIDLLKKNKKKLEADDDGDGENKEEEEEEEEEVHKECPICLVNLTDKADIDFDDSIKDRNYVQLLMKKEKEFMKAPCGHCFHIPCLTNWMIIKMECPSCRAELPTV